MVRKLNQYRSNCSFLLSFILLMFTFLFLLIPNASAVTQVSLQWDPNTESDLAGYRVFCREQSQSYDYADPCWEGIDTSCTIFDLDETKTYCFVARAFDTQEFESENSVEVCNEPLVVLNQPPTANAGPDQTVNEGKIVSLSGLNSSDPDDGIASYSWVQLGGPSVNLLDPDVAQPKFNAPGVEPEGASLTFELTVADYGGNQGKDTCVVNITWENEPPQADAGSDQTVNEGVEVALDGSFSVDIDDGIKSHFWKQTGGPDVALSDPTFSQPTFTAPDVGPDGASLTFDLTVTDNGGLQNTDSCIVNVTWQNEPPRAVVTPDYSEVPEGTEVTMDGSASEDSDDGIAAYAWTQVEGDPVVLSDPTLPVTKFTAPKTDPLVGKNIKLKLTVKDHGGLQGEADSSVYIIQNGTVNIPPAAAFSYKIGKKVVTFKDQSTDDGSIVSWLWDFGDGDTSIEKNPEHRYVKFADYTVTLTVSDDQGAVSTATQNFTVSN